MICCPKRFGNQIFCLGNWPKMEDARFYKRTLGSFAYKRLIEPWSPCGRTNLLKVQIFGWILKPIPIKDHVFIFMIFASLKSWLISTWLKDCSLVGICICSTVRPNRLLHKQKIFYKIFRSNLMLVLSRIFSKNHWLFPTRPFFTNRW